jgi:hypothetical protein
MAPLGQRRELHGNRIVVALRAWTRTDLFGDVQREPAESAKRRLTDAGVKIPI